MSEHNTRQRISELQTTILNAEDEISRLRAECTHPTYHNAMYMWRVGGFYPCRICDACDAALLGITEEESKAVWDSWQQGTSTSGCTFFYNQICDPEAVQSVSTESSGEET